jgi:hypothetical protein
MSVLRSDILDCKWSDDANETIDIYASILRILQLKVPVSIELET